MNKWKTAHTLSLSLSLSLPYRVTSKVRMSRMLKYTLRARVCPSANYTTVSSSSSSSSAILAANDNDKTKKWPLCVFVQDVLCGAHIPSLSHRHKANFFLCLLFVTFLLFPHFLLSVFLGPFVLLLSVLCVFVCVVCFCIRLSTSC